MVLILPVLALLLTSMLPPGTTALAPAHLATVGAGTPDPWSVTATGAGPVEPRPAAAGPTETGAGRTTPSAVSGGCLDPSRGSLGNCGPLFSGEPAASASTNASPTPENGTLVATVGAGSGPNDAAYDSTNHRMYIVNRDSDNITVLNGTSILPSIGLPAYSFPDGVAYDPVLNSLFVSEYGPSTVAEIHNGTIVTTFTVGAAPIGVAYNSANGLVYVANSGASSVSVLNATMVVATITVGNIPEGITYDAVDGYIDVVNSGASTVSVISGTSVIHTLGTGTTPQGAVFDPSNGLLYAANSGAGTVSVFQGWVRIATLRVGSVPWGLAYDPANNLVYVANSNSNTVSVINDTTIAGKINVGGTPHAIAYNPANGAVYVVDNSGNAVSVVSTLLWEGPTSVFPVGNPVDSADMGQNVTFNSSVWGVGAGGNNASVYVAPGGGLGCPSYTNLTDQNGTGEFVVKCHPIAPGSFNVSLVVTDQLGKSVWSAIPFRVYAGPASSVPLAHVPGIVGPTTSADVHQPVTFLEQITGGSGPAGPYNWSGLTASNCTALTTSRPVCTFPGPVVLVVYVAYTDTNGRGTTSPPLHFQVYVLPVAALPTASPAGADVGQTVTFSETPTGGPGTFRSFVWTGLPSSGCTNGATAHPKCPVTASGELDVSVAIVDTNGGTATSPTLRLMVSLPPSATIPTASRSSLDTGQRVSFSTTPSGGSGAYSYSWEGLPSIGCTDTSTASPTCTPTTPGPIGAWVIVTDSNGGVSQPTPPLTVTVLPHPAVGAPDITPASTTAGSAVTIRVALSGGSGGNHFTWTGLPPGCGSTTAVVTCQPSTTGSYSIRLSVTDSNGYTANSTSATLDVATSLPTLFGLSPPVFYGSIAGVALVLVLFVVLLVRRRRRSEALLVPASDGVVRYQADDPRIERARRKEPR